MKLCNILLLPLLCLTVVTSTGTGDLNVVNNAPVGDVHSLLTPSKISKTTESHDEAKVVANHTIENAVPIVNAADDVKPTPSNPEPPTPMHRKTTTTKPTTTASTTTTTTTTAKPTTPSPSPTTTVNPTPTTAPPTPAKPEVGTWNVTKPGTNATCILAKMAIQLELQYSEKNVTKKTVLNIPANATASGICNVNDQQFTIKWNAAKDDVNYVNFSFLKNATTSEVSLKNIGVIVNSLHIPNVTTPLNFYHNHSEFEAPLERSYKCNKEQVLSLNEYAKNKTNCTASLKVSQVQIQAFLNSTSNDFGKVLDCLNSTPDIVPIAVGCALAALVVIVLLAYLYGRRRSQARGYLSM